MDISLKSIFSRRNLKLLFLFAIVFIPLFWWNWINDPHRKIAEQYLHSDNLLKSKIGLVESLDLIRKTTFLRDSGWGNAKEPDRIRYRFIVKGKKGKADVTLVVQISDTDQVENIEIQSIDL